MVSKGQSAILLALVTSVVRGFTPSSGMGVTAAKPNVVPNQYIVETSSHSVVSQLEGGGGQPRSFYDPHRKRNVPFAVSKVFSVPDIFYGGVFEINDVFALSNVDGVISVKPSHRYPAPQPVSAWALEEPNDSTSLDPLSTNFLTGVDKVHAQGFTGEGIKIGIIDTGIDYTHPALGGGFGPGFKVAGGYDFVGDSYDGVNLPVQDPDPLDQCNGHGTHVAGIIGADPGIEYNISGVAYNATLHAYSVVNCKFDGIDDPALIDALARGYNDGMDILTLSLSSPSGFSEGPVAVVASGIAKTGVVVTSSAGNNGRLGAWYTSYPAGGKDVISVGSVDNTVTLIQNATIHVNDEEVEPIVPGVWVGNIVSNTTAPRTPTIGVHPVSGNFTNGTAIPDGECRLFMQTLKIFGNPDDPKDTEAYLSPVFVKIPASP